MRSPGARREKGERGVARENPPKIQERRGEDGKELGVRNRTR